MSSLGRWQVKLGIIILWCVTIFTPLVIGATVLTYSSGVGWEMDPMYMFLFGAYFPPGRGGGITGWVINPIYIPYVFISLLFFIIYPILVTKYCMRPTSQGWAIIAGLISLAISSFMTGFGIPLEARLNGIYAGPLPFQFIVGLVVMQIVKRGVEPPKEKLLDKKQWWEEKETDFVVGTK